MLKIVVIGAGHLGKIHLRILQSANFVELIGFFDQSEEVRNKVKEEMDIIPFASVESFLELIAFAYKKTLQILIASEHELNYEGCQENVFVLWLYPYR